MAVPPTQGHMGPRLQLPPSAGPAPQMASPTKEVNTASLCKVGQEQVEEIVQKTSEIFLTLKATSLPNGTAGSTVQMTHERRAKLDENIKMVATNFKRLQVIYNKVCEHTTPLQDRPIEDTLPIEEDGEVKGQQPKVTEALKYFSEEHRDAVEQLQLRNRQLKTVIDNLRLIIWEINTMMSMRRS